MSQDKTTEVPSTSADAWWRFFEVEDLKDRSQTGNWVNDMRLCFEAGWAAAVLAMRNPPQPETTRRTSE